MGHGDEECCFFIPRSLASAGRGSSGILFPLEVVGNPLLVFGQVGKEASVSYFLENGSVFGSECFHGSVEEACFNLDPADPSAQHV